MFKVASGLLVAMLAFVLPNVCKGADISDISFGNGSAGFVIVAGQLNRGNEKAFDLVAQRYAKGAVLFVSQVEIW